MQPQPKVPISQRRKLAPSRGRVILASVGYGLWLAAFAVGGTFWGFVSKNKTTKTIVQSFLFRVDPQDEFQKKSLNILLLGCDEDLAPGGKKVLKKAGRADMILLAHLDLEKNTITGISVPRDTRTQLPNEPAHKINAYHNLAAPEEANQKQQLAVEYLTGVSIDRTIVLDYVEFVKLINLVEGITLTIKDKMDYDDNAGNLHVHFKPGKKTLTGYDALAYVRFRKDSGGDYKRTERQRQLLMAFKNQVVKNWKNLPEIVGQGVKVIGEDTFSDKEVAALAIFGRGVQQKDIKMLRLPTHTGQGSFEELDRPAATKMLREYGFLDKKDRNQG